MTDARTVSDLGEFRLIEMLAQSLPAADRAAAGLQLGIGDDAAVWRPAAGEDVVITADSLVEDIHFRLDWTDWERLGHKVLAVNISDLAATGATPKLAVVSMGLRGVERVADLQACYRGLGALARRHGMTVAGGDIVRSPSATLFHVTALGETRNRRVLTRAGARPGDIIAVSGTLGASAAGFRLLALDQSDPRRQAATADIVIGAHLQPEPRVSLGHILLEHAASAAMDLSDGLLGDLPKILAASKVSGEIDARRVPVAAALHALFPNDWHELALRGGEDYELLFTAPPEAWDDIVSAAAAVGASVTAIGTILPRRTNESVLEMTDTNGVRQRVQAGAFDHFRPA